MTVLLYVSSENATCFLSLLKAISPEHIISLHFLLSLFSKKKLFFSLSGCHLNITRRATTDFEHLEGTYYANKVRYGASILMS